ncbi:MAG: hypothetical protein MR878_04160 [Campylobacter sp.]|nr:hypothetical protein [Campylobacter sp.]
MKIQRKIFAAADAPPLLTASAAALKLKIAHPAGAKQPADAKQKKSWSLVFTAATANSRIPKSRIP